jgi:hypothetical protein
MKGLFVESVAVRSLHGSGMPIVKLSTHSYVVLSCSRFYLQPLQKYLPRKNSPVVHPGSGSLVGNHMYQYQPRSPIRIRQPLSPANHPKNKVTTYPISSCSMLMDHIVAFSLRPEQRCSHGDGHVTVYILCRFNSGLCPGT